ncbi:MAG: peptidoglycan DD-metalloendopeptidase family protein [Candidatus Pelagadaptatus aseana]
MCHFKVFNILNALLLLTACASPNPSAPVSDRAGPPSQKLNQHVVARGETLFSIAWRYGHDYKTLARNNGIAKPYTIYPGQLIRLSGKAKSSQVKPVSKKVVSKPAKAPVNRSKTTTSNARSKSQILASSGSVKWRWPAKGKLLATFSSQNALNKGVDIAGNLGEPVVAAGAGVVVYAGSGLRGYGNLLIIKHSETFLSAYAHNRRLLVKEGQAVKAGQKIAEIGSSGTDRNKLHFEIRKEGKPVNPLWYLPKRS